MPLVVIDQPKDPSKDPIEWHSAVLEAEDVSVPLRGSLQHRISLDAVSEQVAAFAPTSTGKLRLNENDFVALSALDSGPINAPIKQELLRALTLSLEPLSTLLRLRTYAQLAQHQGFQTLEFSEQTAIFDLIRDPNSGAPKSRLVRYLTRLAPEDLKSLAQNDAITCAVTQWKSCSVLDLPLRVSADKELDGVVESCSQSLRYFYLNLAICMLQDRLENALNGKDLRSLNELNDFSHEVAKQCSISTEKPAWRVPVEGGTRQMTAFRYEALFERGPRDSTYIAANLAELIVEHGGKAAVIIPAKLAIDPEIQQWAGTTGVELISVEGEKFSASHDLWIRDYGGLVAEKTDGSGHVVLDLPYSKPGLDEVPAFEARMLGIERIDLNLHTEVGNLIVLGSEHIVLSTAAICSQGDDYPTVKEAISFIVSETTKMGRPYATFIPAPWNPAHSDFCVRQVADLVFVNKYAEPSEDQKAAQQATNLTIGRLAEAHPITVPPSGQNAPLNFIQSVSDDGKITLIVPWSIDKASLTPTDEPKWKDQIRDDFLRAGVSEVIFVDTTSMHLRGGFHCLSTSLPTSKKPK